MDEFKFMFGWLNDIGKYKERVVGRDILPNGLTVSTAFTSDYGFETAIIDEYGASPVERYKDKSQAQKGHVKWIDFCELYHGQTITELEGLGGLCPPQQRVLAYKQQADNISN